MHEAFYGKYNGILCVCANSMYQVSPRGGGGVERKHFLAAAAGYMCWMPTKRRHAVADIVILALHITKGEHRISRRVFLECKKIAKEEHIRNWAYEVRCILAECNLLPWWQNNSCRNGLNHSEFRNVAAYLDLRERMENGGDCLKKTENIICNFQGKVYLKSILRGYDARHCKKNV